MLKWRAAESGAHPAKQRVSLVSHSTSPTLHLLQMSWWGLSGQWLGKEHPKPIPSFDYSKICCGYESICTL